MSGYEECHCHCLPSDTIQVVFVAHMKKIPEKLQRYNQYKDIKRIMKEVVYESESMDKFETNWGNFIAHFGLVDNQWLTSLYEE